MKKHIIFLFTLLLIARISFANVIVGQAAIPDNYYNAVDSKKNADNILNALHTIIDNHTVISYSGLEPYYEQTDMYSDTIWDMYSTCNFSMDDANCSQKAICDCWNKEHSIPQSWFKEGSPMKSDLFHVYPTDARVNNFRSNLPYGEVNGSNGTGFPDNKGGHGLGKKGSNTFPGFSGTVFEPADDYKGDFARTYFYMVARYRDKALNNSEGSAVFTSSPTDLTDFAKNLFLKWHRNDPVSQKEIDRNQAVYGIQHNRNPFIDYPELAEYIWGNKAGQTVDLSSLTPTCEGGGYDPGVTVKYGVSWSVNGIVVLTDSVIAGRALTLPDTPVSCSDESDAFMGWTTAPISGSTDQKPVLYNVLGDFPVVTENVTYYAVFAHGEAGEDITPATYTYDADHQEGWTNTAFNNSGSYWILREGQYLESPSFNLAGLSSIVMNMRSYGGGSYTNINVLANESVIATLVATGNSLSTQTWTNTSSLSGIAPLRFVSVNATTQNGAAFKSVVINATGSGITFSGYITSCEAAGIDETGNHQPLVRKLLIDGQLYIEINNQLYTITGQKFK